jgi:D-2-hydroxyacid dehydrogenase (NADP+)
MAYLKPLVLCLSLTTLFLSPNAAGLENSLEAQTLIQELSIREGGEALHLNPKWKKPEFILIVVPQQIKIYGKMIAQAIKPIAGDIDIKIYSPGSVDSPSYVEQAEVVIGFCRKSLLDQLPKLIWFQNIGSGSEGCSSLSGVSGGDFTLTNIRKIAAAPIAEHAISMVLMLNKNLHRYHHNQRQGEWKRYVKPSVITGELSDKTLLVLGLGGIGSQIAKRADALGMRVIATRNSSRSGPDYVAKVGLAHELYALAKEADFVVNALPLTTKTTGLIDQKFFASMKKGAAYLSVGRGRSTNQNDLLTALKSGQVGGAGLDVTDPEPLPSDHPLWTIENIVITPHIAGMGAGARKRTLILFQENLRRYLNGDKLLNVVNINRGY